MKKRLNKSANCSEIAIFRRNNILYGILFRPKALLELRKNMLDISSLLVGCRNIVPSLSFERYSERCLCECFMFFCSFNYEGKIIVTDVSNIMGIGYSVVIIKGEYSWYIRCYIFQRNKGFNSFPCVLNIILISFKIFFIISLLTVLHKGGE